MDDLISRNTLVDAIKRQYCVDCDSYNGARCRACHADDMLALADDSLPAGPRWISVEERLPEDYEDVVIIMRNGASSWYRVAYREYGGWSFGGGRRVTDEVTHWMPLPEPPEEE